MTLLSISLNDLDNRAEHALNKFADDATLRVVADTPGSCAAIQRDVERMEKWPDRILLKFNKKC